MKKLKRLETAASNVTSLPFSVCLVQYSKFKKHGKLLSHEDVQAGFCNGIRFVGARVGDSLLALAGYRVCT